MVGKSIALVIQVKRGIGNFNRTPPQELTPHNSASNSYPSQQTQQLRKLDRTEPKPGGKSGGIAESTDIGSDLGEDHLCGDGTHSRDIGEIDASDAVQFAAKIE